MECTFANRSFLEEKKTKPNHVEEKKEEEEVVEEEELFFANGEWNEERNAIKNLSKISEEKARQSRKRERERKEVFKFKTYIFQEKAAYCEANRFQHYYYYGLLSASSNNSSTSNTEDQTR